MLQFNFSRNINFTESVFCLKLIKINNFHRTKLYKYVVERNESCHVLQIPVEDYLLVLVITESFYHMVEIVSIIMCASININ